MLLEDPYRPPQISQQKHFSQGYKELLKARKILLVRLDNIGDVIMIGPAVRALRAYLKDVHITLMASPAGRLAAPLVPGIDATITERTIWQDMSGELTMDKKRELAQAKRIRKGNFDAAIIFTSFSQSPYPPAFACYLAGIPVRIAQSKEFGGGVLTHWIRPPADELHQVDRNLHLLESLGLPSKGRDLQVSLSRRSESNAEKLLRRAKVKLSEEFVAVVPGASCQAREYPIERFVRIAGRLARDGIQVVLLGSAKERVRLQAEEGLSSPLIHNLAGFTGVGEFAAIISKASLVFANDSSAMHLADAFGRPSVVLFSGTDRESQWQPRFSRSVLLRKHTDCAPCYRMKCPYGLECLDIDPAEAVISGYQLMSGGTPRRRHERLIETTLEGAK
ncbi:MAG: glycosyltransferase family 9 protein [Deltaproteobacteria bacterium]|nr:glycosyltransferase family 9 protein [Deltaproteobacteria bacterium]